MKGKMKFALVILLVFMVGAVTVSSASAAEIIVQNTLDNKVHMAFVYYDRASGLWTTRGWQGVDGNSSKTIKYDNLDASRGVYYIAMRGKTIYLDKSTLNNDTVRRWVRDETFVFDFSAKPSSGTNRDLVTFYKSRYSQGAGAFVIRIDTRPVG